jgi:hypothetical protein
MPRAHAAHVVAGLPILLKEDGSLREARIQYLALYCRSSSLVERPVSSSLEERAMAEFETLNPPPSFFFKVRTDSLSLGRSLYAVTARAR